MASYHEHMAHYNNQMSRNFFVISHVFMVMSHVSMVIGLFTYAYDISIQVRVSYLSQVVTVNISLPGQICLVCIHEFAWWCQNIIGCLPGLVALMKRSCCLTRRSLEILALWEDHSIKRADSFVTKPMLPSYVKIPLPTSTVICAALVEKM